VVSSRPHAQASLPGVQMEKATMTTMMVRSGIRAIALSMFVMNAGCGEHSPTAPAATASAAIASADGGALTSSSYTVTLRPDLTASPSSLSVPSGYKVLFVNNSGRGVALHSYNCSQFTYMSLNAGYSKNTLPFSPSGKVCDYLAYDNNYQKIFEGRITVQ
jgi:hypothetical protein